MTQKISHLRAVAYAVLGYTVWVLTDCCSKLAGQAHVPLVQILGFSSLFSAGTIFLVCALRGQRRELAPKHFRIEAMRFAVYLMSSFANVMAFTHLPLTTVYVGIFLSPMLVSLGAALFMGELISWKHGLAIVAGFLGVLLAVNPAGIDLHGGAAAGYIALPFFLLLNVAFVLMTRLSSRGASSVSLAFIPQFARSIVLLPICLWLYEPMQWTGWLTIVALGLTSATGWLLVSAAIKHAPMAMVTPFNYSQIITGALMGYLIWSDIPDWHLMVGAAVIIASGLYIANQARKPLVVPA